MNGTLGVIEGIDEGQGVIYIVSEDGRELEVERACWSNMRYTYNDKEQKIEEEEIVLTLSTRYVWHGLLLFIKARDLHSEMST